MEVVFGIRAVQDEWLVIVGASVIVVGSTNEVWVLRCRVFCPARRVGIGLTLQIGGRLHDHFSARHSRMALSAHQPHRHCPESCPESGVTS
jgi:hypothetical protein